MAIELDPAGVSYGALDTNEAVLLVAKTWAPHAPPRPIGPGELNCQETNQNRVYWQWQQGENWRALMTVIATECSLLGVEQLEISEYRYLASGFGCILDELGAPVGLERSGLPEELYRQAIAVRGASMISDAGIDAVMAPAKAMLGDANVTYLPTYPAAFCWVVTVAVPEQILDLLQVLLAPLIGCGIGAKLLLSPPETPGWDWSTPQAWAASWSSSYGVTDLSVAAAWGWAIPVG